MATFWRGKLHFGRVEMAVRFDTAAEKPVTFHLLHKCNRRRRSRIRQSYCCANESRDVTRAELIKGYEHAEGQYIEISDKEFRGLNVADPCAMEVLECVPAEAVTPEYLESSYHLAPEPGHEKAYAILFQALGWTKLLAITRVVMHQREHMAVLRPSGGGLLLQTLYYHDDVRREQAVSADPDLVKTEELQLAMRLARALTGKWEPEKYSDTFRTKLAELVEAKLKKKAARKRRKSAAILSIAQDP